MAVQRLHGTFGHVIHFPGTCLSTVHDFCLAYELLADNYQSQINFLLTNRSHNYMLGLIFPNGTPQIMSDANCIYDDIMRYIKDMLIYILLRILSAPEYAQLA